MTSRTESKTLSFGFRSHIGMRAVAAHPGLQITGPPCCMLSQDQQHSQGGKNTVPPKGVQGVAHEKTDEEFDRKPGGDERHRESDEKRRHVGSIQESQAFVEIE